MKKRLLAASCIVAATVFLLARCAQQKKVKSITTTQAENKKMSRVKAERGLEYEVLQEGTGESPQKGDYVAVHYTGWIDVNGEPGNQFDSSLDRGEPFVFPVGMGYVIKGWDLGVITMKVGEKRRLFIPSELGYGAPGAGKSIPPHANLIFDVELLQVQKVQ